MYNIHVTLVRNICFSLISLTTVSIIYYWCLVQAKYDVNKLYNKRYSSLETG